MSFRSARAQAQPECVLQQIANIRRKLGLRSRSAAAAAAVCAGLV